MYNNFIIIHFQYMVQERFSSTQVGFLMKPFLYSVCLTMTLLCSLTRITDRRHHWWDVLTGDILGLSIGLYFIFRTHKKVRRIYGEPNAYKVNTPINQVV